MPWCKQCQKCQFQSIASLLQNKFHVHNPDIGRDQYKSANVVQNISTSRRCHLYWWVSSVPLQSKKSSSIQQLLCSGDSDGFFKLDLFCQSRDQVFIWACSLKICPTYVSTSLNALGMECTKVWCLLSARIPWGTPHVSHLTLKQERKKLKIRWGYGFAQKSLGRRRMICSSYKSVLQARDCFDFQSKCS